MRADDERVEGARVGREVDGPVSREVPWHRDAYLLGEFLADGKSPQVVVQDVYEGTIVERIGNDDSESIESRTAVVLIRHVQFNRAPWRHGDGFCRERARDEIQIQDVAATVEVADEDLAQGPWIHAPATGVDAAETAVAGGDVGVVMRNLDGAGGVPDIQNPKAFLVVGDEGEVATDLDVVNRPR